MNINNCINNTLNTLNLLCDDLDISYVEVNDQETIIKHFNLSQNNKTYFELYKNEILNKKYEDKISNNILFYFCALDNGYLLVTVSNIDVSDHLSVQKAKEKIFIIEEYIKNTFEETSKLELFRNIFNSIPLTIAYKDTDHVYQIVTKKVDNMYKDKFDTIVGKSVYDVYPETEVQVVLDLDKEAIESKQPVRKEIDVLTDDGFRKIDAFRMPIFHKNGEMTGVLSLGFDISEFKHIEYKLDRNNSFQKIILEFTKSFVNINIDKYDQVFMNGLKMISTYLNADRARIFEYDFSRNNMFVKYEWDNQRINSTKKDNNLKIDEYFDDLISAHLEKQYFITDDLMSSHNENKYYKLLLDLDITNLIIYPIFLNNECYGFIEFDAVNCDYDWESDKISMNIIPQIISSALLRNLYDLELRKEIENAQQANRAKSDFLAIMSHEIRTPISGISNAHQLLDTTTLANDQKEYLQISQLSLDSLTSVVNNILDYSKIESRKMQYQESTIDIETLMCEIIQSQKHLVEEKNLSLHLDYDYSIKTKHNVDAIKLKQIILNLVNNAVKFTIKGEVNIKVTSEKINNNYQTIKFQVQDTGIGIQSEDIKHLFDKFYQTDSSLSRTQVGTGLGLSIAYQLSQFLGGDLDVSSEVGIGSTFEFTLTLQRSEEIQKFEENKKILYIDFTQSAFNYEMYFKSINIDAVLYDSFSTYTAEQLNSFSFVIINISDPSSLSLLEGIISEVNLLNVRIILVSNNRITLRQVNTMGILDTTIYSPISRSDFLSQLSNLNSQINIDNYIHNKNLLNKKCLLVEDNKLNRKALSLLLEKLGLDVYLASDGIESIELTNTIKFDLIFMDLQMPIMNGFEAVKIIRESSNHNKLTTIVALTANALKEVIDKCYIEGFNDVLAKPFERSELQNILLKFLSNEVVSANKKDLFERINQQFNSTLFEIEFGKSGIIEDIIDTFLDDTEDQLRILELNVSKRNFEGIQSIVHYLKVSYGYMHANHIIQLSNSIMQDFNSKKFKSMMDKTLYYLDYSRSFINEVIEYKEKKK